jgi:hypothetical protein
LLDRIFEHPVGYFPIGQDLQTIEILALRNIFPVSFSHAYVNETNLDGSGFLSYEHHIG